MSKKRNWLISLLGPGVIPGLFSLIYLCAHRPVTFESLESVTQAGAPVFNQIRFIAGLEQDTWIMRQSHHGPHPVKENWDRLAIVVDKKSRSAKFYQLRPGLLEKDLAQAIPLRVRCLACHASGPRAIRPVGWHNFATVALLNLRIKTYGALIGQPGVEFAEGSRFGSPIPALKQALPLQSCRRCHTEGGLRSALTMEQLGTVNFLVKKGAMPPFPFKMAEADRRTLQKISGTAQANQLPGTF